MLICLFTVCIGVYMFIYNRVYYIGVTVFKIYNIICFIREFIVSWVHYREVQLYLHHAHLVHTVLLDVRICTVNLVILTLPIPMPILSHVCPMPDHISLIFIAFW